LVESGERADAQLLEPSAESPKERLSFQEELQYRLDIALVLFESAYASLQSKLSDIKLKSPSLLNR
jgi:hypothetical protein